MDRDRFRRVEEIYRQVASLPPTSRATAIADACAGDDGLRAEVERLLGAAPTAAGLAETTDDLAAAAAGRFAGFARAEAAQQVAEVPDAIGPYRIVGVLGRGGMGMVLEGEREQPKQRVAIKVIAPGLASESLLQRFELEAQVLASLRHPGIAVLHDAGRLGPERGHAPWFAMEFVHGALPLCLYAERKELDLDAKVRLFRDVCQAVEHGHRKGFLHRDLKPDNILVDEDGRPKIIDFGLARGMEDLRPDKGATVPGQLLGTPAYMSPEQAGGAPDAVDARTDVYAMGVVLYELLTGRLPYDLDGPLPTILRTIAEEEPKPPSTWDRRFRGDLDVILRTALAKSPDDRYRTIADLSDDLQRWREGRPISVRRDSIAYVITTELLRRKVPVAIGLVVVALAIGAGVFFLSAQYQQAMADAATAAANNLSKGPRIEDPFDPFAPPPEEIAQVETYIATADLDRNEEAEQRILLGQASIKLADYERAGGHLERAVELLRELRDVGPEAEVAYAEALHERGRTLYWYGRFTEAEEHYRDALAIRRRLLGENHFDVANSVNDIAACRKRLGDFAAAEPGYREALRIRETLRDDDRWTEIERRNLDLWIAASRNNLGTCLRDMGRFDEALPLFVTATDLIEERGKNIRFVLRGRRNEAGCLIELGRLDDARELLDGIRGTIEGRLGTEDPDLDRVVEVRSRLHLVAGESAAALAVAGAVVGRYESRFGRPHPRIVAGERILVDALLASDRGPEALDRIDALLADARTLYGEAHPDVAAILLLRAEALLAVGEASLDEVAGAVRAARPILEDALVPEHPDRRRLAELVARLDV